MAPPLSLEFLGCAQGSAVCEIQKLPGCSRGSVLFSYAYLFSSLLPPSCLFGGLTWGQRTFLTLPLCPCFLMPAPPIPTLYQATHPGTLVMPGCHGKMMDV